MLFDWLIDWLIVAFSEAKTGDEGMYDSATDGIPYGRMTSFYSGLEEIYDDIDEPNDPYTWLRVDKPKEDTQEDTKEVKKEKPKKKTEEEDLPTEAPEPPPMRPHTYLELVNLWGCVPGIGRSAANIWFSDITMWTVG